MTEPIFTRADLHQIGLTRAAATNDIVPAETTDHLLRVTRDRTDIGIPTGRLIAVRDTREVPDGELALVFLGHGEHVLARAPVTEGTVVGLVLGVLGEVPDA